MTKRQAIDYCYNTIVEMWKRYPNSFDFEKRLEIRRRAHEEILSQGFSEEMYFVFWHTAVDAYERDFHVL